MNESGESKIGKANALSRENYVEREREIGNFPTFEIEKSGQVLYYFGAHHSKDPNSPQYEKLKLYWQEWLQKTDPSKRLVLIEGGTRVLQEDEETSIRISEEGGLMTFLAHGQNIRIESPEPDDALWKSHMLEKHSPLEIALYEFITMADSWRRMMPEDRPDFKTHALNTPRRKYYDEFTPDELIAAFENVTGEQFDPTNVNRFCDPNRSDTVINRVARTSSDLRDQTIAEQIISYWKDGKSLFMTFGRGHLVIQEPMLRAAIR